MEIILPVVAAILIAAFVGYLRRSQPQVSCPQCQSRQVRPLEQSLEKIEQDSTMGYAVKLDVKLILKTSYRCQTCGHSWTVIAAER